MSFYSPAQRAWQDHFGSVALADRVEQAVVADQVDAVHGGFIASRDFFYLATVDADGMPTVSYKGGNPGLVAVVDAHTLAFPNYDGNGMYLSMGNVSDRAKIGMLFIDLETPNRVRVQATATVSADDELLDTWPGATLVVRARVEQVFHNCGRYVHRHVRVGNSRYVPDATGAAPHPAWKRIDALQDVLAPQDRDRTEAAGGVITFGDYTGKLARGES
jgi:predicted pyridoxine 5'-phosphate oxidase superfamily flavin-nucleotide-binding protein